MKLAVYPKKGELCRVILADSRYCPVLSERYEILNWISDNDTFLVLKVLQHSKESVYLDVLYKDTKGLIRINPRNIELLKE